MAGDLVVLDGGRGEGGGQILRTALTLSMITGRGFRLENVRANRSRPGLRPQHLAAVEVAGLICSAEIDGARVGSRKLTFRPGPVQPRPGDHDIGTAGSTCLVLQTIQLPLALAAREPISLLLRGGTFNEHAPSFPFLKETWQHYLAAAGMTVELEMPAAGFFPVGRGVLTACVHPGRPQAIQLTSRGPRKRVRGVSATCNIARGNVAERMRDRACQGFAALGVDADIEIENLPGRGQGAALAVVLEFEAVGSEPAVRSTYVSLGERGKPAEVVADEAVAAVEADIASLGGIDAYSADQILLPLSIASGASRVRVVEVTSHLRTNIATIAEFLDRRIVLEHEDGGVVIATDKL